MPLPYPTLVGNLTADPELRFTPSGKAVTSFTVACSERKLNKQTNEWEDGESLFMRCSAWEQVAESIAENCVRGTSVVVTGKMYQRSYETREGEKRTVIEMQCTNFAVTISRSQSAKPNKIQRASQAGPSGQDDPWGTDDPWGSPPPTSSAAASTGGYADEPPF